MSSHHIYNLCVNAKWVRDLCDMVAKTEKKIRIGDIIKMRVPLNNEFYQDFYEFLDYLNLIPKHQ